MMIVDAGTRDAKLGVSFRQSRPGPEQQLIEWFLEDQIHTIPRGCQLTIFREPRLPSGFPDLVIVIWKESVARKWIPARAQVRTSDIRLMHHLTSNGPSTTDELKAIFGHTVNIYLERLQEASMIRGLGDCWRARPLSVTFAASRIVAVEAKVKEWRGALNQALVNTWFASSSYILVPRVPRQSELLAQADSLGVGVLTKEGAQKRLKYSVVSDPRSYISWLFNEWAWRAAME